MTFTSTEFFLALAVVVCLILIVGFLFDRKILKNKALQALQASALNQIRGVKNKMPYSPFSPTVTVTVGPAPVLLAPSLVSTIADANDPSLIVTTWQLPPLDKNGATIQAMSELHVYATKKGVIGELTALFGMEPNAKVPVNPSMAGQTVNVTVGPLEFETDYDFNARLKE